MALRAEALVSQGFRSLLCGTLHPLAKGTFTNPQGLGYLRLFPASLFQLKGAEAPTFTPIGGLT
jgi:hypothetical protein